MVGTLSVFFLDPPLIAIATPGLNELKIESNNSASNLPLPVLTSFVPVWGPDLQGNELWIHHMDLPDSAPAPAFYPDIVIAAETNIHLINKRTQMGLNFHVYKILIATEIMGGTQ